MSDQAGASGNACGKRARVILHLEDDDASANLFRLAICELTTRARLYRVATVEDALSFLDRQGIYRLVPRPDVAVLDINLAGRSGFDVLRAIKGNPFLASLPVVMFSSSLDSADRDRATDLGAEDYMIKSIDLAGFFAAAETAIHLAA